jgi:hypothetical protein
MSFHHPNLYQNLTAAEAKTIGDVYRVLHAVFDPERDADPADIRKLYRMLKPGTPEELESVTVEKAA